MPTNDELHEMILKAEANSNKTGGAVIALLQAFISAYKVMNELPQAYPNQQEDIKEVLKGIKQALDKLSELHGSDGQDV